MRSEDEIITELNGSQGVRDECDDLDRFVYLKGWCAALEWVMELTGKKETK